MTDPVSGITSRYITDLTDMLFPSLLVKAAFEKDSNQWSALYGPYANKTNLREVLIKRFKNHIDETPYTLTYEDINLGLTAEGEKAAQKAYVEKPDALFSPSAFVLFSPRIAKDLNNWLGQNFFSASDFIPRDEDYPKDRNVDPQNRLNLESKNKWMTLDEYIDKVILRVTARAKDQLEAKMRAYLADNRTKPH